MSDATTSPPAIDTAHGRPDPVEQLEVRVEGVRPSAAGRTVSR